MSKVNLNLTSLFAIFSTIILCSGLKAEEEHFRTGSVKLTSKLALESIPSDTAIVMAGSGIDFPVLLQQALEGNVKAVRLLFWTSANVGLDGAAADGFCAADDCFDAAADGFAAADDCFDAAADGFAADNDCFDGAADGFRAAADAFAAAADVFGADDNRLWCCCRRLCY